MEEYRNMKILKKDQEAIVLCLVLGTLEAIKYGSWPLESGIWTLARPVFWEPLKETSIPKEVIEFLSRCDELKSLEILAGKDNAINEVEKIISLIHSRLAELSDKTWLAFWP